MFIFGSRLTEKPPSDIMLLTCAGYGFPRAGVFAY